MPGWAGLALGIVALLLAAKAHGRQLRLEREAAGHFDVVFGGRNPPFVEALWAADRTRFWTAAPLVGLALGAATWIATDAPRALVAATLGGGIAAFALCGALSALRAPGADRAARAASALWWGATGASTGLAAWALLA